ncbi:MAG: tetratricopeptide repeat protein [Candidatus Hydrogenedentota bacterium]
MRNQIAFRYFKRGIEHYRSRKWSYAINAFRKAIDLNPAFEEARTHYIKSLISSGRLEHSKREIRKSRGVSLSDNTLYILMGYIAEKEGKYEEALSYWNSANLENEPEAIFHKGEVYIKLGQFNNALMNLDYLIKKYPCNSGIVFLRAAESLIFLNKYFEALGYLRRALTTTPLLPDIYFRLSQCYYKTVQYKKALSSIKQAILIDRNNPEYYYHLANVQLAIGLSNGANVTLESLIKNFPRYLPAYILLGDIFLEKAQLKDAELVFKSALRIEFDNTEVLYKLGYVYSAKGDWEKSLSMWEKLRYLKPNFAEPYFHLGNLYSLKGDTEDAITHYEIFLELGENHPDREETFISLGYLYLEEGMIADLDNLLTRAIEEFKDSITLRLMRAQMFNYIDEPEAAEKVLKDILNDFPNDSEVLYEIGLCYIKQEKYEDCIEVWKKALASDKENFFLSNEIAELLLRTSKLEEAVKYFNKSLLVSPNDTMALSGLAIIYMAKGEYEKSRRYWEHILSIEPTSVTAFIALIEIFVLSGKIDSAFLKLKVFEEKYPDHTYMFFLKGLMSLVIGRPTESLKLWRCAWGKSKNIFKENSAFLKSLLSKWDMTDFLLLLRNCPFEKQFKKDVQRVFIDNLELPLFEGKE